YRNSIRGGFGTIGGGYGNTIFDEGNLGLIEEGGTIGGGEQNTNTGYCATVPGGVQNFAEGDYSFAAGNRAKAVHNGSFVWADSQDADFSSTSTNQFNVRASGGVRLSDNTPSLSFGSTTRQMINLWGTSYGIGVQGYTTYFRCDGSSPGNNGFAW